MPDTHRTNAPLVKIASLYEKVSGKGNRYFVGRLNGARLLLFTNTEKHGEHDADWYLYVQAKEPEDASSRGGSQRTP
jgi:hypothetical protein